MLGACEFWAVGILLKVTEGVGLRVGIVTGNPPMIGFAVTSKGVGPCVGFFVVDVKEVGLRVGIVTGNPPMTGFVVTSKGVGSCVGIFVISTDGLDNFTSLGEDEGNFVRDRFNDALGMLLGAALVLGVVVGLIDGLFEGLLLPLGLCVIVGTNIGSPLGMELCSAVGWFENFRAKPVGENVSLLIGEVVAGGLVLG